MASEKRCISVPRRSRNDILRSLNIAKDDLVLEIGSGDNPASRSDILSDKCLEYTPDREGRQIFIDRRPFVACDGQQLPFRDKSFDYIIASQMLEYVEEPDKFLKELMRVGRRGYIEVANEIREVLFDWDARNYVVSIDAQNKLVIRRKTGQGPIGKLIRKLKDPYLGKFIVRHWPVFNYLFEWDGMINYTIDEAGVDTVELCREVNIDIADYDRRKTRRNKIEDLVEAMLAFVPRPLARTGLLFVKKVMKKAMALKTRKISMTLDELLKRMVCPVCHGEIRFNDDETAINCQTCRRIYPCIVWNRKKIPVMLPGERK